MRDGSQKDERRIHPSETLGATIGKDVKDVKDDHPILTHTHTHTHTYYIHPSVHSSILYHPRGIVAMSRFGSDVVCCSFMTSREDREQSIPTNMSYCFLFF